MDAGTAQRYMRWIAALPALDADVARVISANTKAALTYLCLTIYGLPLSDNRTTRQLNSRDSDRQGGSFEITQEKGIRNGKKLIE